MYCVGCCSFAIMQIASSNVRMLQKNVVSLRPFRALTSCSPWFEPGWHAINSYPSLLGRLVSQRRRRQCQSADRTWLWYGQLKPGLLSIVVEAVCRLSHEWDAKSKRLSHRIAMCCCPCLVRQVFYVQFFEINSKTFRSKWVEEFLNEVMPQGKQAQYI